MHTISKITPMVLAVSCLAPLAGTALAETVELELDAGNFSAPTQVDNMYIPLPAGTTFTYFAETGDGCEYNKLSVSALSDPAHPVTIDGDVFQTLVVRDQEWVHEPEDDGECDPAAASMAEDTLDFYGQDDDGNVWYFGEDTWSVDDETGECSPGGSWEAGVDDAEPGILMLAGPASGLRYRQEYWEDEAEDWAAVMRLNASVAIEYEGREYENCLETREWTPLEPGSVEHKFYCPEGNNPGPGLVYIQELMGVTVHVEYTGPGPLGTPGEFLPGNPIDDDFPSAALGCED